MKNTNMIKNEKNWQEKQTESTMLLGIGVSFSNIILHDC